jgi:hypothetical protein
VIVSKTAIHIRTESMISVVRVDGNRAKVVAKIATRRLPHSLHGATTTTDPMDLPTLASLSLPAPDGSRHTLGELWSTRPVVLVFLRHFG